MVECCVSEILQLTKFRGSYPGLTLCLHMEYLNISIVSEANEIHSGEIKWEG
jgi:hypothetical protein